MYCIAIMIIEKRIITDLITDLKHGLCHLSLDLNSSLEGSHAVHVTIIV